MENISDRPIFVMIFSIKTWHGERKYHLGHASNVISMHLLRMIHECAVRCINFCIFNFEYPDCARSQFRRALSTTWDEFCQDEARLSSAYIDHTGILLSRAIPNSYQAPLVDYLVII